jgi:hypothetical protein
MMTAVRQHWDRARRLHMHVKVTQVMEDNADSKSAATSVGSGAFAALLVAWTLAQRAQTEGDADARSANVEKRIACARVW